MRIDCDIWTPSPKEVEYLTPFGTGRRAMLMAIVAIGYHDQIAPSEIGRACWLAWDEKKGSGFSPGTTTDEHQRRLNWASGASKARNKWNLDPLTDQLIRFRKDGGKRNSVSWTQMIERCDHLILHGSASESMRAIEIKTKLVGKGEPVTKRQLFRQFVSTVGPERTWRGLTELGFGHLTHVDEFLVEVERYDAKNSEDGNGESRSAARCAGDDAGNFNGRGARRSGEDAAQEVDRGPEDAGGVGKSQRAPGSREFDERVSRLEQRA